MSRKPEYYVADIIRAAGGRLASRVRLQKLGYLLDQLGLDSGFRYAYHHYGPYSRDLDSAILDAEAFGLVQEDYKYRQSDGARYSIFQVAGENADFTILIDGHLQKLTKRLTSENVTVLELAATAHWLDQIEKVPDWQTEIRRRKGWKTEDGRLEKAARLLQELGLPPTATTG